MSLLRQEDKPSLGQRLSIGAMTGGIIVLLAVLVGAFVVVPVLLLQSSRHVEAEEAEAQRRAEMKAVASAEEKRAGPPRSDFIAAKTSEAARPPADLPKPSRAEAQQVSVSPPPAGPPSIPPGDAVPVDPEGFIRSWLVLAPIRSPQQPFSGAQEIHKSQLPNEARLRPREGDRAAFHDKERVWQRVASQEYLLDFVKIVGAGRSDDAIAYAVCYVHAPQAMSGLKLQMGSNDQAKVYLNGAQLLVFDKTRTLQKDQSTANDVQLQRGENLLVFKVVNEKKDWQGCVRFTDRNNQPVRSIHISLLPQ